MLGKILVTLVLLSATPACENETTLAPRSARPAATDTTKSYGADDLHGSANMPGKGRGTEDHHSLMHK